MQKAICEHLFRKAKDSINLDGGLGDTHAEEWEQSLEQSFLVGRIVCLLLRGFSEVVAVRRTLETRNPLIRNVIIACVGIWVLTD